MENNIHGVLICSGLKNEIFPATLSIPKALYPIGNTPLLIIGLEKLAALGIKEITLVISRSDRMVIECLVGNGEILGLKIEYYYQDARRGLGFLFEELTRMHGKILARVVDFIDSNFLLEDIIKYDNIIYLSNSLYHKYEAEYLFSEFRNSTEVFENCLNEIESVEIKESSLVSPRYIYTSTDAVQIVSDHAIEIMNNVNSMFGDTQLLKNL